jgi:hypothetical protein
MNVTLYSASILCLSANLLLASCSGGGSSGGSGAQNRDRDAAGDRGGATDEPWMNVFDDQSSGRNSNSSSDRAKADRPWTIAIATFGSADHRAISDRFREEFIEVSGLREVMVDRNESRSILHYGAYGSANDPQLETDLARIRAIEIEERTPFARAFQTVLATEDLGQYPQFNLLQLRKQFSRNETLYSLQIGFYTFESDAQHREAKRTVEEFVARLRAEGEMAFYYHGQTKSHVCIGVFFEDDVDAITGYSKRVRDLQQRYPNNLDNGKQIIQTRRTPGGEIVKQAQQSFLIAVPQE